MTLTEICSRQPITAQFHLLWVAQENLSWFSVLNIFHKITSATSADYMTILCTTIFWC